MEQIYRIGIDHGYGNIKTAHYIFESGVIERTKELKGRGLCNASVILAVGLPIKWLGEQGNGWGIYHC